MTSKELDETLYRTAAINLRESFDSLDPKTKQLFRQIVANLVPDKVHEIKADTYYAGVHDGINHCVLDIEANTKELLG